MGGAEPRPYGVVGVGVPDDPWGVAVIALSRVIRRAACPHAAEGRCGSRKVPRAHTQVRPYVR